MGRGRIIRPQLFTSERLATRTDGAARLYMGAYPLVDDKGNCPAGPTYLRGAVFYGRSRSNTVVGRLLGELQDARLIDLYTVDAQKYLAIIGWSEPDAPTYQVINRPSPPQFPLPTSVRSWNGVTERSGTKGREEEGEVEGNADVEDHHGDHRLPSTSLSGERSRSTRQPEPTSDQDQIELPVDWRPNNEHRALAATRGVDVVDVASKFRAHAKGARRIRAEWDGYFTRWIETEYPRRDATRMRIKRDDVDRPPPIPAWHSAASPASRDPVTEYDDDIAAEGS